jgi:hypothetical protein
MILVMMMMTPRNKRKILKRNSPEFINSDEFSSSIPIDPNHLDSSTLQRDQKE